MHFRYQFLARVHCFSKRMYGRCVMFLGYLLTNMQLGYLTLAPLFGVVVATLGARSLAFSAPFCELMHWWKKKGWQFFFTKFPIIFVEVCYLAHRRHLHRFPPAASRQDHNTTPRRSAHPLFIYSFAPTTATVPAQPPLQAPRLLV